MTGPSHTRPAGGLPSGAMTRPPIDPAQVRHLATLACLSLSDGEVEAVARELDAIVGYIEQLANVDTSEVDHSCAKPVAAGERWRPDVLTPELPHELALEAAPRATTVGFAVPGFVVGAPASSAR